VTANKLPTDRRIQAWRLAGRLVCQCAEPVPVPVPIFGGHECRVCRRLVLDGGEELIRLTLDELEEPT